MTDTRDLEERVPNGFLDAIRTGIESRNPAPESDPRWRMADTA